MSGKSVVKPESLKPSARRVVLKSGATLLLSLIPVRFANAAQIAAVRVWPANDYTRVTLETDSKLKSSHFLVSDPNRLVVEIEGVELDAKLKSLVAKIQPNDPYIAQVRLGQNRPGVVRMVFDLKAEIQPQVFTLSPVGEYRHRLVFDLYPAHPVDLIAELLKRPRPAPLTEVPGADSTANPPLAKSESPAEEPLAMTRMVTIALDPGHGGEDPGAVGRGGHF
ncbi:MAG: AMIN domain-containing protein, partial [Burkholderiaceae bacterium]